MSIVSDVEKSHPSAAVTEYDAVVVGAGPYGLSAAAHLMGRGLKVAVFGKTLELWRERMPKGMYLRSHWWASNLSDPKGKYSFARFFKQSAKYKACYPVPIEAFIEYALWFQKHAVPNVDETYVSSIERKDGIFELTLEDGRIVHSPVVVMAIGLYYYANRPAEYTQVPAECVSHAYDHGDFSRFAGKKVLMIGAGQSAVEYSALLNEAGAAVHLVARRPIHWLDPDRADERGLIEQIKAPNAGIAPGWKNWILEYVPYLFYTYPQERKDRYIKNNYQAAANDWLRERVIGKVVLHEKQKVTELVEADGGLEATLSNGEKIKVDHVMMATGYIVNVNDLPMLHSSLKEQIESDQNIPVLNHFFECSVPGMYFLGLTSLRSFGPLYRFVVGAKATAQRVANSVVKQVARSR